MKGYWERFEEDSTRRIILMAAALEFVLKPVGRFADLFPDKIGFVVSGVLMLPVIIPAFSLVVVVSMVVSLFSKGRG